MSDPADRKAPLHGTSVRPGIKLRLEERLGLLDALKLVGYRGHGTTRSLHLKGRLFERKVESRQSRRRHSVLRNMLRVWHRFDSDEIPGARLRANFCDRDYELFTDEEGYFQINIYVDEPLTAGWHAVDFELLDAVKADSTARVRAEAYVPAPDCEFGVISDLDDTVIESRAHDKLQQLRLTLLHDAASRTVFDGVATLYQALVAGPGGRSLNPIFYLSRSGWNLYDFFMDVFDVHGLPAGPVFLRDLAYREAESLSVGTAHHKLARTRDLLQLYPELPFVLIGDSGQKDAERYRRIALEYPGRIRAIYLRNVTGPGRAEEVAGMAAYLRRAGVPTLLGSDSNAFAEHMYAEGLISHAASIALAGSPG